MRPASPLWFARHELRLAFRDLFWMLTTGKRRRLPAVVAGLVGVAIFMHALAYSIVAPAVAGGVIADRQTLIVVTGAAFLSWTLMLSQAMETVTRAFYARADLDLILSSPAPARTVFALRLGAIGLTTIAMAMLIIGAFINVLAVCGGSRWLMGYGVLAAMGCTATAIALGVTALMFRLLGPKRTRLVAQIVAAVVGAGFVIGVQAISIVSFGSLSRFAAFHSPLILDHAPAIDSVLWLPARAAMGDGRALILVLAASLALLAVAVLIAAQGFAQNVLAAAGISQTATRTRRSMQPFRIRSPGFALRRKEWSLLRRDPWLLSQSLMQLLYLLPPALLLWHNFGSTTGASIMIAPVLVMASGQLAGGLAWLTISGEDAPELVASAPVTPGDLMRAKIAAVLGAVALVMAPLLVALAVVAPAAALVTAAGVMVSAGSATAIQLFFRAQAKRSQFRRRQTSSRLATFAEAFSSITWAAVAGLALAGTWLALAAAAVALCILAVARMLSPRRPAFA